MPQFQRDKLIKPIEEHKEWRQQYREDWSCPHCAYTYAELHEFSAIRRYHQLFHMPHRCTTQEIVSRLAPHGIRYLSSFGTMAVFLIDTRQTSKADVIRHLQALGIYNWPTYLAFASTLAKRALRRLARRTECSSGNMHLNRLIQYGQRFLFG